ncbi:MAG: DegQ family serine endoprotease [Alphaproteobacteria bacterium]|nr:MAG: DegQ family serine endoprotease [Alphaproteobacteria bacterium]
MLKWIEWKGRYGGLLAAALVILASAAGGIGVPATAAAAPREMPGSFADLVEKLSPAVVNISTTQRVKRPRFRGLPPGSPFEEFFDEFFNRRRPHRNQDQDDEDEEPTQRLYSLGSGFIIDPDGYIVTNNHVVQGAETITVRMKDGEEYEAKLVGRDAEVDIALLKIDAGRKLPYVEWGDSDTARVGDWVLAIGNPFGLGGTVTAGIISARHRQNLTGSPYEDYLQTDASINRGNSGGPMFNLDGKVIGINTMIFSPSGGNIGIGFAIPSNLAKKVVAQIKEYGYARRGYIGVVIQSVDKVTAEAMGLPEPKGALVAEVTPGGPADKAGIKPGDVIVAFNGKEVKDNDDLVRLVSDAGIGVTVKVDVLRNGKRMRLSLKTAERPKSLVLGESEQENAAPSPEAPKSVARTLGLRLSNLTPAMRERFDIADNVQGVIVTGVSQRAAMRDLRPGDIITEVSGKRVSSVADVARAVAELREKGRKAVLLRILRGDQALFRSIPLPEDEDKK